MSASKGFAVIAGVGPGTGASIARKFAKAYPVVLLARNPANYEGVVSEINSSGGKAVGISTDVADAASVSNAFKKITSELFPNTPLAAAIFNPGGGFARKPFLELTEAEYTNSIDIQAKGGFLFSQASLPLLLKGVEEKSEHPPSLIFTGATASVRGSANFAGFASGKFALRALSQSLAREFGPKGVHVSHIIVDGIIDIPRLKHYQLEHEDAKLSPDSIADSYWFLHTQPRTTFAFELDLRPAGVIGLSTALRLQSSLLPSQRILIIARNLPHTESVDYASPWAGAHYRPVPGSSAQVQKESQWARHTYQTFQRIASEDVSSGVKFMPGIEHFESPTPEYVDAALDVNSSVYAHLGPSFRNIPQRELQVDSNLKLGIEYWTYCVNTPLYLGWLLRRFVLGGGQVRQHALSSLDEAFVVGASDGDGIVKTVVNCSGTGFNDEKSFIIRGQTCLVRNQIPYTLTRHNADGTWSFAIPRPLSGGTIIGGTKQPNDWNPYALPEIRETLLRKAAKWFPFSGSEKAEFSVIRDVVGRRPAREGGVRIEVERVDVVAADTLDGQKRERKNVVHAYGLGGRGVELSWGVAEEVRGLMLQERLIVERASL
ncbi:uncharacterized protein TRUGW13939_05182 [Talaromyces rugulosus]|uniref:FAD dependent oxidoreductase domain-containing protein n=1 Tax=Talaromyces rugulosus TaxID=121627 RepID=A0A7H8QX95_TALRU|nr:uncharacterized protein TRUGW13939_05182 [Talaromyces rugulosus]QKX58061.1 hypothetical protein TRUGW13939_05182 [Talaromyces rugulosus]